MHAKGASVRKPLLLHSKVNLYSVIPVGPRTSAISCIPVIPQTRVVPGIPIIPVIPVTPVVPVIPLVTGCHGQYSYNNWILQESAASPLTGSSPPTDPRSSSTEYFL